MNLNFRFTSFVISIVALAFLANANAQQMMYPTPAVPDAQFGTQQFGAPASVSDTDIVYYEQQTRPLGFSQFMGERYQDIGSHLDYTPELVGTYDTAPIVGRANRIGVATVTDYVLGQRRHSPLRQQGIAQASFFQPVALPQAVGAYDIVPANVIPAHVTGNFQPNARPRLFGGTNIGGERSIFKAFWDKHWTRMVLVYGGVGNSEDNGGDIFDGQTDTDLGIVGIDIGRRHSQFMRSSIDFTYRGGDVDFGGAEAGDLRVYSLMKNFHLDLARRGQFRPYIGVGIGGAVLDADANLGDNAVEVGDEGSFAFQIMGGVARNISELAAVYAEYRFFSTTDVDVITGSGPNEGRFTSHDVLFGLRFGF